MIGRQITKSHHIATADACSGCAGTLLSLESVGEVMDYWGHNAGPITWRLTEAQVKEVLGQRTDFEPHEIAALDL